MTTRAGSPRVRQPSVFGADIIAGFSTRSGGTSVEPYRSMNVGLSTGDDEATVTANRARLFRAYGLDPDNVAIAGQVHGGDVALVRSPGLHVGVDALVTDVDALALAITAADCTVVLLADSLSGIIGAAHSGWRGTLEDVVSSTIFEMVRLGAAADRILAYVSPCISADRFEVGEEVASRFDSRFVLRHTEWRRPHLDLRGAIAAQLLDAGVDEARIEVSPDCTFDHPDFFSYRADGSETGRMMGFIARRGD